MQQKHMQQSWVSSTIDCVYNTVAGDEHDRSVSSDYQKVFSNDVWINDLPTTRDFTGRRPRPKQVRASISFVFLLYWLILTPVYETVEYNRAKKKGKRALHIALNL